MSDDYETRMPSEFTRQFGVEELHVVVLQPLSDRGAPMDVVVIELPDANDTLELALAFAREHRTRIQLVTDTAEQARAARREAERLCPEHRFISIERVMAGAWVLT